MTTLARWLTERPRKQRSGETLSVDEYSYMLGGGNSFGYNGLSYGFPGVSTTLGHKQEEIHSTFEGYVEQAFKANGVVFACMVARMLLFSEARFQFRDVKNGRPGELFGTAELDVVETPWPNGTTGQLLARAIQDVDLSGNFYANRQPGPQIRRLRPDWVTIVAGSKTSADRPRVQRDAEVIGYIYHPGGKNSGEPPVPLLPNEVAHWAPYPDPMAQWRGMSWLTPIVREIMGDAAATTHKLMFFENGAVPGLVVSLSPDVTPEEFEKWVEIFEEEHRGVLKAYESLFLGGGAQVTAVGGDMKQVDFTEVQGAGEVRITAASGVPPMLVAVAKGLEASTYSNYQWAMRRFADMTMRPLWRTLCESLDHLVPHRKGAHLWYDTRDIPALAADVRDRALVHKENAVTANLLIEAGYEPDAVTEMLVAGDFSILKGRHTGLVSVQLQLPGQAPPATTNGTTNGKTEVPAIKPESKPKPKPAQSPRAALGASADTEYRAEEDD